MFHETNIEQNGSRYNKKILSKLEHKKRNSYPVAKKVRFSFATVKK